MAIEEMEIVEEGRLTESLLGMSVKIGLSLK
jgi:hypothetical protein